MARACSQGIEERKSYKYRRGKSLFKTDDVRQPRERGSDWDRPWRENPLEEERAPKLGENPRAGEREPQRLVARERESARVQWEREREPQRLAARERECQSSAGERESPRGQWRRALALTCSK